jgi:hypothetical protein
VNRISLLLTAAISAGFCIGCQAERNVAVPPNNDCTPVYDSALLAKKIRPDDELRLYATFEELPLYAMPDCVDEAYGLTWIPSFPP